MNRRRLIILGLFAAFLVVATSFVLSSSLYQDMQSSKKPRYEIGQHLGPKLCGSCHKEIYQAWLRNSAHAVATTNKSFLAFKEKFTSNFLLNTMMGEGLCYACHGSKDVNRGVDCETCHGSLIAGASLEETHEKKFKPRRRTELKEPDFCPTCHSMKTISGDFIFSLYDEWQKSEVAKDNITCQGCHMKPRKGDISYHGFDSISRRNAELYHDKVTIDDVKLDFPEFSLTLENRVRAHAVPASGPSRVLALEITLRDKNGVKKHEIVETFLKRFDLMPVVGLFPNKLTENSQLQGGEARSLSFKIPAELKGKVSEAIISLRFYDVDDEHQGDIKKAHWISKPVFTQKIKL